MNLWRFCPKRLTNFYTNVELSNLEVYGVFDAGSLYCIERSIFALIRVLTGVRFVDCINLHMQGLASLYYIWILHFEFTSICPSLTVGRWLHNVEARVGNSSDWTKLSSCGTFVGPSDTGQIHVIECGNPLPGTVVTVKMVKPNYITDEPAAANGVNCLVLDEVTVEGVFLWRSTRDQPYISSCIFFRWMVTYDLFCI